MTTRKRHTAVLAPIAAVAAFALACAPAASARTLSPLPASDYSVRSACAEPVPGQAGCLALELVPDTQAARAHSRPLGMTLRSTEGAGEACESPSAAEGCFGMRPSDLHHAYELPDTAPAGQTIALVDAYNDPTAETDLKAYDEEFALPACTAGDGCFKEVNQEGEAGNPPFPKTSEELEAHEHGDTAEKHEADGSRRMDGRDIARHRDRPRDLPRLRHRAGRGDSATEPNLEAAENAAVGLDAGEISNSWGGPECIEEGGERECLPDSSAFEHPGTVITVAAGRLRLRGLGQRRSRASPTSRRPRRTWWPWAARGCCSPKRMRGRARRCGTTAGERRRAETATAPAAAAAARSSKRRPGSRR